MVLTNCDESFEGNGYFYGNPRLKNQELFKDLKIQYLFPKSSSSRPCFRCCSINLGVDVCGQERSLFCRN